MESLMRYIAQEEIDWAVIQNVFVKVFIILVFVWVVSVVIYFFLSEKWMDNHIKASRVLLFTAHPDDEVMFFGPLLLNLLRDRVDVHLVCLSQGEGEGRIEELWNCTERLGLPPEHVVLMRDDLMPDSNEVVWPEKRLATKILRFIETYDATTAISFDEYGVSGHSNHKSISYAMHKIVSQVPDNCRLYALESVSIFRKYTLMMDLMFTLFSSFHVYLCPFSLYPTLVASMSLHKSQFVWFRKLYVIFSRYMYINSFKEIK